jgi:hypothetical protein
VLRGVRPLTALLERLRETFGLSTVSMLERQPDAPERRQSESGGHPARLAMMLRLPVADERGTG